MHHFFVDKNQIGTDSVVITGADVKHISQVLRMKCGELLRVSDRKETGYRCRIAEIRKDCVVAEILEEEQHSRELPARVYLFQGLPKSDKMELIIQKAVELGVYQIIPVKTQRTVARLDQKKAENKLKRWNSISESAAKQSQRLRIPKVTEMMSLEQAYEYSRQFSLNLIPYEEESSMKGTKELLSQVQPGMEIGIFIGPEGGFETHEIARAAAHQIYPITLGQRILRTETAGFTILSILMYLLEV